MNRHLVLILGMMLSACGSTNFGGTGQSADADATKKDKASGKSGLQGKDAADGAEDGQENGASDATDGSGSGKVEGEVDAGMDGGIDSSGDGEGGKTGEGDSGATDGESPLVVDDGSLHSISGFECPANLKSAEGEWEGTWTGVAPQGLLQGTVKLTMQLHGKKSLDVKNYQIEGGYAGHPNEIVSIAFDFVLTCGDASFPPVLVHYADGQPYYVLLKFTHQAWDPPALKGIGLGGSANPSTLNVGGGGTWAIHKK